jgi:tetratricopeptide (TPR) repeat protein
MVAHLIIFVATLSLSFVCPNGGLAFVNQQEITVSAGIPEEQLDLEKECDRLISEAKASINGGSFSKALDLLDKARDLIQKHSFLASRGPFIAAERGNAHFQKGEYKEAVLAFTNRLELEKRSCDKRQDASPHAIACGQALMDLGSVELATGGNESALSHLREAAACFEIWIDKGRDASQLAKLGYRVHYGEATVLAGVAASRLGDRSSGRNLITAGIEAIEKARTDPAANAALVKAALQAVAFAKEQLTSLK